MTKKNLVAICILAAMLLAASGSHATCRLDWNEDGQVNLADYLTEGGICGVGFYAEWYIWVIADKQTPGVYDICFPGGDPNILDLNQDGVVDQDDLMGDLSASEQSEGYYVEWYIFMFYAKYYDDFFPEYSCLEDYLPEYCLGDFDPTAPVGVVIEKVSPTAEGWTTEGYDPDALDTYRVYATFDDDNGSIFAVGAGYHVDPLEILSSDGAFVNSVLHNSIFAPSLDATLSNPETQWDTFVTIGETVGTGFEGAATTSAAPYLIGQLGGIAGDVALSDTGWYAFSVSPVTHAVDGRVLLAQFTVAEGVEVTGINWRLSGWTDWTNPEPWLTGFDHHVSFSTDCPSL